MKNGGSGDLLGAGLGIHALQNPWGRDLARPRVYFEPVNDNFMDNGGGRWMEPRFYQDLNAVKVTLKWI